MRTLITLLTILALVALPGLVAAESYDDKKATTDMNNPDSLYELAMWCAENNLHRAKVRHLRAAVKLNPDHAPAREALGFVYYNDDWVHKSRVPASARSGGGSGGGDRQASGGTELAGSSGPGPTAEQIEWNLTPLDHPDIDSPKGEYIRGWVQKTQTANNMTSAMESAWRTLLMEEHFDIAIAIISQGLASGQYKDLYAPAMMIAELSRNGDSKRLAKAEKLMPFIFAAASKPGVQAGDLQTMAMMAASSGEKRAIPLLIDLLDNPDEFTAGMAKMAISQITFLPEQSLTKEQAQQWWDRFHSTPDSAIYGSLLNNKDPMVKLGACQRLYKEQDKRILPVLVELLRSGNATAYNGACALIERICGNDWGLLAAEGEARERFIKQFEDWATSEDGRRHVWVEFQQTDIGGGEGTTTTRRDQSGLWVSQLNSLDADEKRMAFTALENNGEKSVPALIKGLSHTDAAIADKCRELLREITGQNFGFDALGSQAEKDAAIKQWQDWADGQAGDEAPE